LGSQSKDVPWCVRVSFMHACVRTVCIWLNRFCLVVAVVIVVVVIITIIIVTITTTITTTTTTTTTTTIIIIIIIIITTTTAAAITTTTTTIIIIIVTTTTTTTTTIIIIILAGVIMASARSAQSKISPEMRHVINTRNSPAAAAAAAAAAADLLHPIQSLALCYGSVGCRHALATISHHTCTSYLHAHMLEFHWYTNDDDDDYDDDDCDDDDCDDDEHKDDDNNNDDDDEDEDDDDDVIIIEIMLPTSPICHPKPLNYSVFSSLHSHPRDASAAIAAVSSSAGVYARTRPASQPLHHHAHSFHHCC